MLEGLTSWFWDLSERLFGSVEINNSKFFDAVWNPHKDTAIKELGHKYQALTTIAQVGALMGLRHCRKLTGAEVFVFHNCASGTFHNDLASLRRALDNCREGIVGDPNDVHFIIPPCHFIGYALYRSQDGEFVCEVIEGLYKHIQILRRKGRVIAAGSAEMLRMESSGGVRVF